MLRRSDQEPRHKRTTKNLFWRVRGEKIPDAKYKEPEMSRELAAFRVMQHHKSIVRVNPVENKDNVDEALRCVVMKLLLNDGKDTPSPP